MIEWFDMVWLEKIVEQRSGRICSLIYSGTERDVPVFVGKLLVGPPSLRSHLKDPSRQFFRKSALFGLRVGYYA